MYAFSPNVLRATTSNSYSVSASRKPSGTEKEVVSFGKNLISSRLFSAESCVVRIKMKPLISSSTSDSHSKVGVNDTSVASAARIGNHRSWGKSYAISNVVAFPYF